MNIDEIEQKLNNLDAEPQQVIAEILKMTINNQATLAVLLDLQLTILNQINPKVDQTLVAETILQQIQVKQATIQAEVTARLLS